MRLQFQKLPIVQNAIFCKRNVSGISSDNFVHVRSFFYLYLILFFALFFFEAAFYSNRPRVAPRDLIDHLKFFFCPIKFVVILHAALRKLSTDGTDSPVSIYTHCTPQSNTLRRFLCERSIATLLVQSTYNFSDLQATSTEVGLITDEDMLAQSYNSTYIPCLQCLGSCKCCNFQISSPATLYKL